MTTDEQIRHLQKRIESLEKQVKNLEDQNENLAGRLTDAEDTIDELAVRIDELEEEVLGPEVKETARKFRLREALEKEEAKSVKER
jgi:septal ring factor EnvC (AmiA/AmiB activator)